MITEVTSVRIYQKRDKN